MVPNIGQVRFPVVILPRRHISDEIVVHLRLANKREWSCRVVRGTYSQVGSVANVLQEHHVLLGRVVVKHIHSVGVLGQLDDNALVGPMDQVGRRVGDLVGSWRGAAIPVEDAIVQLKGPAAYL